MAQFDVYQNNEPESNSAIPFLLDIQNELHETLTTRVVVPLVSIFAAKEELRKLCPKFKIHGRDVLMSTPEAASYPLKDLGPKLLSLTDHRDEILAAIDFLLSGF